MSILDLQTIDFSQLKNINFVICQNPNGKNEEQFLQIKASKMQQSVMFQIIDISTSVMLDKQKAESKLLTIVNATVSHELRNPLNAIMAINMEKDLLYQKLGSLLDSGMSPKQIISETKVIYMKLMIGKKVHESSSHFMKYLI